ncbi:MAG: hypothetical protein R6U19_01350 [Bacteroidales bacterium]
MTIFPFVADKGYPKNTFAALREKISMNPVYRSLDFYPVVPKDIVYSRNNFHLNFFANFVKALNAPGFSKALKFREV